MDDLFVDGLVQVPLHVVVTVSILNKRVLGHKKDPQELDGPQMPSVFSTDASLKL